LKKYIRNKFRARLCFLMV